MQKIYILRHAQSESNARRIVSGARDNSSLSELGLRQSALAGKNAQTFKIDLIASSPQKRAIETAQIIAESIGYPKNKIWIEDNFHERDMGEIDGVAYEKNPANNGNARSVEGTPGLEPLDEFYNRAKDVLKDLQRRPEKSILLVCHNGIGRMLRAAAANASPEGFYDQPRLTNAIIYELI